MNNAKIGMFISEKRKSLGLTQQELAEKLQITNKAVSKWETGDGMPDVQLLSPLANELGVTVDEILNGEEKQIEESFIPASTLSCKPLPVRVITVCMLSVFCGIYNIALCFSSMISILSLNAYGDSFFAKLTYVLPIVGFAAYWLIITIILMCRLLKIFGYNFKAEKTLTIVAFIAGFIMLLAQGLDYSPVNYGLFFFSFALILGTYHGYRVPHKVFYGLAILATCVFGIIPILRQSDYGVSQVYLTQLYGFILRFVRAFVFYVFYGLLEKLSSEYQKNI
ncbi:MAG: helix-turn-helix transcriptional regulator [Clostridia bacterium]|nr:helix-turn-helix transcriptional regulator [Clostridia bacterium]